MSICFCRIFYVGQEEGIQPGEQAPGKEKSSFLTDPDKLLDKGACTACDDSGKRVLFSYVRQLYQLD